MVMGFHTLRRNILWGVRWGSFLGGVYCLFALFVLMVRGFHEGSRQALLAIYIGGGMLGGTILGMLRPWIPAAGVPKSRDVTNTGCDECILTEIAPPILARVVRRV